MSTLVIDSMKYISTKNSPSSFYSDHLEWRFRVDGLSSESVVITALIDNGSHSVLIDEGLVTKLGLRRRQLPSPQRARLAMGEEEVEFTEWVKLRVCANDQQWTARMVRAIVTPKLAYPVLLGGLFLKANKIVIDHEYGRVTAKGEGYHLLPGFHRNVPDINPGEQRADQGTWTPKDVLLEWEERTKDKTKYLDQWSTTEATYRHFEKMLKDRVDILAVWDDLTRYEQEIHKEFKDQFPKDIPHITRLPDDVYHCFRFKDPEKVIKYRSYTCPKKYKDVWKQLLDQHLAAGRIRESSSEYCSPLFLIPRQTQPSYHNGSTTTGL